MKVEIAPERIIGAPASWVRWRISIDGEPVIYSSSRDGAIKIVSDIAKKRKLKPKKLTEDLMSWIADEEGSYK